MILQPRCGFCRSFRSLKSIPSALKEKLSSTKCSFFFNISSLPGCVLVYGDFREFVFLVPMPSGYSSWFQMHSSAQSQYSFYQMFLWVHESCFLSLSSIIFFKLWFIVSSLAHCLLCLLSSCPVQSAG